MLAYFAYGSNTDLDALALFLLRQDVDPAGVVGPHRAILHNYRLRTNYLTTGGFGAANVEPRKGSLVEGVVMQINAEVHDALRRKEGCPFRYHETEVIVQIPQNGEIISAMTYVVSDKHRMSRNMPVSSNYRDAILRGASTFRFSRKYQAKLRSLLRCA